MTIINNKFLKEQEKLNVNEYECIDQLSKAEKTAKNNIIAASLINTNTNTTRYIITEYKWLL